jgi:hypothetical protein
VESRLAQHQASTVNVMSMAGVGLRQIVLCYRSINDTYLNPLVHSVNLSCLMKEMEDSKL